MKKNNLLLIFKGIAIGIANVIPGVSGGTIALITGIYEDLINCIKKINLQSLRLIYKLKFLDFAKYTNFKMILYCGTGVLIGVIFFAKIFEQITKNQYGKLQLEGLFFGLILASIYYVGKKIEKWNTKNIIAIITGAITAIIISNISINTGPNTNELYIFICGTISTCGMILPGLSGSYILILMGNYELLMIDSINYSSIFITELIKGSFNNLSFEYVKMLLIFVAGSVFGMLFFANIIAWLYKKYKNNTLSILTGFIIGSLTIIWPWKKIFLVKGVEKYAQFLPTKLSEENIITFLLIILGVTVIYLLEKANVTK